MTLETKHSDLLSLSHSVPSARHDHCSAACSPPCVPRFTLLYYCSWVSRTCFSQYSTGHNKTTHVYLGLLPITQTSGRKGRAACPQLRYSWETDPHQSQIGIGLSQRASLVRSRVRDVRTISHSRGILGAAAPEFLFDYANGAS